MYYLSHKDIVALNLAPADCVSWVYAALSKKDKEILPSKISISLDHNIFFNTMPCYLSTESRFGVKVVSRFPLRTPSLSSHIILYDSKSGQALLMADGDWITAMRTGASAALSIRMLESPKASVYGFIGLGNTARATLLCLLEERPWKHFKVRLLQYKDQVKGFIERFKSYNNVSFEIVEDNKALISGSDVVISSLTVADSALGEDSWFKEGVLVVPIHTMGFQNCDLFFDRIYCDDIDHIKDFRFFERFKLLYEIAELIKSPGLGRESDRDRILVYNIGIALLDVYFVNEIYKLVDRSGLQSFDLSAKKDKFWV